MRSICQHCGIEFTPPPRYLRRPNGGAFCSRQCTCTANNLRRSIPWQERFWAKVKKSDGCWEWGGGKFPGGYGSFWRNGHSIGAHCVAWELTHGSVPGGMMVCHSCDNPGCCNPSHLFIGTDGDNMADKVAKGRQWRERNASGQYVAA